MPRCGLFDSEFDDLVYRTALFLKDRCNAEIEGSLEFWDKANRDHNAAIARTEKIRSDFENPVLKPFDHMVFWGSWKWTGKFATEFTWVGRMIMNSLIENDARATQLCCWWLKTGTFDDVQSEALRYALNMLTNENFETDRAWVDWYFGKSKWFKGKGEKRYPEPDLEKWQKE